MATMGRPKNPVKPKKLLKEVLPVEDIFEEDELKLYNSLIDIYLADFEQDDLTSADMDDIMGMATNKVLEVQLLKSAKSSANKKMDITNAMEKIRKQTEKMKENLSSRRRDRIDPNKYKGFSIVNLAAAFDNDKKEKLLKKQGDLKEEEKKWLESRKDYAGNRLDVDTKDIKEDDEE